MPIGTYIDFTLSNARRFYSSMGNPLGRKGLRAQDNENMTSYKGKGGGRECSYTFSQVCTFHTSLLKSRLLTMETLKMIGDPLKSPALDLLVSSAFSLIK